MFECRETYEAGINHSACLLTDMHLPHLVRLLYAVTLDRGRSFQFLQLRFEFIVEYRLHLALPRLTVH